ncbi:MAG: nitroreductase family protein [Desulfuromonadales bacterium]|nr:nitroreductase family protein [Desulfuromonadales bacterium]
MLNFSIDADKCTRCGLCAKDCPTSIIKIKTGDYPYIPAEKERECFRCQHCLAVCPPGALSILGRNPEQSLPLEGNLPDPLQLETLIKGRRSVRSYRDENLDPALLQQLLDVAWHAPTGHNACQVRLTVIDDKQTLASFRDETYAGLARLVKSGNLPAGKAFFADFVNLWQKLRIDVLFRGAPHLVVASAPRDCASPLPDCLIALSYFELFAQSQEVGTLWNGLVKWAIDDLVPELRQRLQLPSHHLVGYAMVFGKPAIRYQRTVEKGAANIVRLKI